MTPSKEVVDQVETKILEIMEFLQKRYPHKNLKLPVYNFKQSGAVAGRAYSFENKMELNPDYFVSDLKDMIDQTIPHELAHLVSYQLYGLAGSGHGRYWKSVMQSMASLGVECKRCHDMDMTHVKTRKVNKPHKYVCLCHNRIHNLTNLKHNKIQRGCGYRCITCRGGLIPFNPSLNIFGEQKKVLNLAQG